MLLSKQQALAQAKWLEQQLVAHKPVWRVVVMHHPIYTFASNRAEVHDRRVAAPQAQGVYLRGDRHTVLTAFAPCVHRKYDGVAHEETRTICRNF